MALNDSFKTSGWTSSSGDVASLEFSWTATQDISGNSSTISWTLKGNRTKATGWVEAGGFKVVIDNDTVYSKSTDYRIKLYNGTVVATGTKTITHNTDGTRSFTVYVEGGIYYYAVNCSGTKTFTLDTIPRASTMMCSPASIGENPTITITRASTNFTHKITYKFGELEDTIKENTSDTTITDWTIPTEFYYQMPNDKRKEIELFCTTYNGSTQVGDPYKCTQMVTTDYEQCKPEVCGSAHVVDYGTCDVTGVGYVVINGVSYVECCFTKATAKNGASITKLLVNGVEYNDDEPFVLGPVGTNLFSFYVEDSRGYNNHYPVTLSWIPYIPLTANITTKRTDPTNGNATITIEGNCYKGGFGIESNHLKITYVQGTGKPEEVIPEITNDNKYKVTIPLTDLLYTESFTYDITVQDALTNVDKTATIGKGLPVFDWGDEDFNFNVPVTIQGVNILEKLAELEELVAAKG